VVVLGGACNVSDWVEEEGSRCRAATQHLATVGDQSLRKKLAKRPSALDGANQTQT